MINVEGKLLIESIRKVSSHVWTNVKWEENI